MITYFPNPYPDELFYSMLARYYTKSGYLAYTFAAEELFSNKTSKPRIEFINPLSETAFKDHRKSYNVSLLYKVSTVRKKKRSLPSLAEYAE